MSPWEHLATFLEHLNWGGSRFIAGKPDDEAAIFPARYRMDKLTEFPAPQGLYDSRNEHDACGVGFVAHIKGEKSHAIVSQALEILANIDHRGAVGADPLLGDGAGILMQIPDQLYRQWADAEGHDLPAAGDYAVDCGDKSYDGTVVGEACPERPAD